MKCTVFGIFALFALAAAFPEGEKPAGELGTQVQELINKAQKGVQEFSKNLQNQLNLDQASVVDVLKNQSSNFVTNVQGYINTFSEKVQQSPEVEKAWTEIKARLNKVVEDINANVPNAKESAEQLQKQFTEGVQTLLKESNNIAEAVQKNSGTVKEEIAVLTKKAVDIAVGATQDFNKQLQQMAGAAEAKN